VALEAIKQYKILNVFSYAYQSANFDHSWPSWIPKWGIAINDLRFTPVLPFGYKADQGKAPVKRHGADTSSLIVQGLNLDVVTESEDERMRRRDDWGSLVLELVVSYFVWGRRDFGCFLCSQTTRGRFSLSRHVLLLLLPTNHSTNCRQIIPQIGPSFDQITWGGLQSGIWHLWERSKYFGAVDL
jgi:hypothetical protein